MGAASATNLAPCHGSGGAKNIQTILPGTSPDPNLSPADPGERTYGHPTKTISGVHTNLDVLYPTAGANKGLEWSNSRHAECVDCHNPHRAQQGTHTPSGQWYPTTVTNTTNNVSNALKGVPGVEPGSATCMQESRPCGWCGEGGGWTPGTVYCVNCHVAVPHGSKRSRLIGYNTDISPYNYNGNSLKITGFKKAATPTGYGVGNCATNCGGHASSISGADP